MTTMQKVKKLFKATTIEEQASAYKLFTPAEQQIVLDYVLTMKAGKTINPSTGRRYARR